MWKKVVDISEQLQKQELKTINRIRESINQKPGQMCRHENIEMVIYGQTKF